MAFKLRKRSRLLHQRHLSNSHSTVAFPDSHPEKGLIETSQKLRRCSSYSHLLSSSSDGFTFDDRTTADVVVHLFPEPSTSDKGCATLFENQIGVPIYAHSHVLERAKYFATVLSDRWQHNSTASSHDFNSRCSSCCDNMTCIKLAVPCSDDAVEIRLLVLELLYTRDFGAVITSASAALDILPVALELLFEDCVTSCVKFLEAVPWTEQEEKRVIEFIPFLREEESKELLPRVLPVKSNMCEEMLHGLILSALHNHSNMAFVKAFVAKLLRDFSSEGSARRVLERAFGSSLKVVKEKLEGYMSPDFRGDHNETEAIQRLNLHAAMTNGRHLLWLVERMIELNVADSAVIEWSEQVGLTLDLQRIFIEDAWRNIVPGLPAVIIRCTWKLASAVASGIILAAKQVRMQLVKAWLPVLVVCKDNVPPMLASHKSLYLDLEETFLTIISTLPMSDAQELLQQCLSFSTRNIEDCPHLVTAFNTWFRRASRLWNGDKPL